MFGKLRHGLLAGVLVLGTSWPVAVLAQTKPYAPKNGVLNWKALVLGGGFRVTTVMPLHGDFAKYDQLEIVRSESLIGSDLPPAVLNRLTEGLVGEFTKGGRFARVAIVEAFAPPAERLDRRSTPPTFRDADPLETPLRTWSDLRAFDRQREASAVASTETLVVRSQVIDYAKGNKWLQLLMLDLGNAVLTVRVAYFDKATGEELGRSVISSDTSSKVIPSALTTRSPLNGLAEGLVDQVTRRKVAGEQ